MKALKVRDVAGRVKGENLPFAARQNLVAAGEAFDDEKALRRPVLVPDDILVRVEVPDCHRESDNRLPLVVRERRDALQLADQWMRVGMSCGKHGKLLRDAGAHLSLSHRSAKSDTDDGSTVGAMRAQVSNIGDGRRLAFRELQTIASATLFRFGYY